MKLSPVDPLDRARPVLTEISPEDSLDEAFRKIRSRCVSEVSTMLASADEEYSDALYRRVTDIGGSVGNGLRLTDGSGQNEYLHKTSHREVNNLLSDTRTNPVDVPTGSGGVVPHSREILTDDIMGCLGIFIRGPKGKALMHMTPTYALAYEQPMLARSVATIVEQAGQLADNPDDLSMVIIANLVDDRISKERHAEWEAVKTAFAEAGIKRAKVVEVPLEHTTVYHSPERPDELMVMGIRKFINDNDRIDGAGKYYIKNHWIPIDPAVDMPLATKITDEDRIQRASVR